MTVRAWFTISALVLAALAAAFAFRLFAPVATPSISARSGDVTLPGRLVAACWPNRSECSRHEPARPPSRRLPASGTLRFSPSYPAEPEDGAITIESSGGETVLSKPWMRRVRYELDPGTYLLTSEARYPGGAYVRYIFRFTVTRSGS